MPFHTNKKTALAAALTLFICLASGPARAIASETPPGAGFNDVLARVSTPLMNDIPNRMSNIALTCGIIDETVLMPGAVFSFNQTVGSRTEARGFKPAPTFMDGRVGESVGGGICQVSSTLYYACLLANLEIVSRTSHSMFPDYAEKPGLDATVSWNDIDYKFRNSADNPVKIFARMEGARVHVEIRGTRTSGDTVSIESVILSSTPYRTIYRDNPRLAPGGAKVVQEPHTGYVAETYRVIRDAGGNVISREPEAKSVYNKSDEIIERGPRTFREGVGGGRGCGLRM